MIVVKYSLLIECRFTVGIFVCVSVCNYIITFI